MTTQDLAPAVERSAPAEVAVCPDVVAHLQECLASAIAIADRHAQLGGIARGQADELLAKAARHDDDAVHARVQVATWERLLKLAQANATHRPAEPLDRLVAGREPYPPAVAVDGPVR